MSLSHAPSPYLFLSRVLAEALAMATPRFLSLSRNLFTITNSRTLTSFSSRAYASSSPTASLSLSSFSFLRHRRPLASIAATRFWQAPPSYGAFRTFATRQSQSSLNDNSPNWSNRPPKETILLDGCDFEHWLVVTEPPPEGATRDEIIDSYIKTLAKVVGSEEEAKMKIYSVSTKCYYAFGALVSEELSYKIKELPNVRWVLPDSYLDVRNKDYGGEPFINGQAVPYDPKYHEEWIRNSQKAQDRNRRNDRPRNADRSRNFDRRQRNMGGPAGNFGGPQQMGGMPNQPGGSGYGPNVPQNNPGFAHNTPQNNPGFTPNVPQNNPGFAHNMPLNNPGFARNITPNNPGFSNNMPPNNPNNMGGAPNMGGMPSPGNVGQGNPGYNYQAGRGMPYQNTPQMPNQQNYDQNSNMGGQPSGGYQGQDVPGRDTPQYR